MGDYERLRIGTKVLHPRYGEGKIIKWWPNRMGGYIKFHFDSPMSRWKDDIIQYRRLWKEEKGIPTVPSRIPKIKGGSQ